MRPSKVTGSSNIDMPRFQISSSQKGVEIKILPDPRHLGASSGCCIQISTTMSDDDDGDLFGSSDSDDTNELLAASSKPVAKKKAPVPKKVAASKAEDSDDSGGLFDSDDSDDEEEEKKPAAKPLSKKERLEALAKSRRKPEAPAREKKKPPKKQDAGDDKKGYESGDSYDSADFQRTKEDDDFIDTTGEDADAVNELYAEQHFDDDRPDREEGPKKKKRKIRYDDGEPRERSDEPEAEPDNPIMAAVHRMKKKKREKKSFSEYEDECKMFLGRMEAAAEDDEESIRARKPAVAKLAMLNDVVDMMTRKDIQRMLLDLDLLSVCKRWIQPLPSRPLGNITVRQKLIDAVAGMSGENGITASDLKRSEFGRVIMALYKHKDETPAMKRKYKELIERWSRPIFSKSGDMRDLERVNRGDRGIAALSRQQAQVRKTEAGTQQKSEQDIHSLIASGKKGGGEAGITRVSVPFSKGFNYSVRPTAKVQGSPDKRRAGPGAADTRGKLSRRMVEKGRKVTKNQRSANISIEGRPTKG